MLELVKLDMLHYNLYMGYNNFEWYAIADIGCKFFVI